MFVVYIQLDIESGINRIIDCQRSKMGYQKSHLFWMDFD